MSCNDEERPRKRRLVDSHDNEHVLRTLLSDEIDVEIGLRARLRETVESRLTWALILQDTLEKHFDPLATGGDTPNRFADLAIASYKVTSEPSRMLIPDDLVDPLPLPNSTQQTDCIQPPALPRHVSRPHVPHLHHEDRAVKEPNKFLFLRDTIATPTMVYKVACPDCGRSDFPRLQGLLNHCRLKHRREFGSHDECVQHCAVVVPEDEQPVVVEQGVEVAGMSASLRRLFEMAVGTYVGIVGLAEEAGDEMWSMHDDMKVKPEESTLVTKTLGHHKDTPALAPFLGRAPKKRQINVFEGSEPVDILSVGEEKVAMVHGWTMTYQERSRVNDAADVIESSLEDEDNNVITDSAAVAKSMPQVQGGSRFHITARLVISDWSLRLPIDEVKKHESQGGATHKWMISVQAPSYSLHASTVLAKVTVSSATDPPPAAFMTSLTVSEPPFCVMGVTDKQFLARITLEWVGMQNKPTIVEHWVELDGGKSARPVLSDEQVIDVELDRNTELQPRRNDTWVVDWHSDTDNKQIIQKARTSTESADASSEPEHIRRLKKILPRFPMTAKDLGPRKLPQLPYYLPFSVQHLDSMVEGRRRAIEWGRARALWELYNASESEEPSEKQIAWTSPEPIKFSGPMDVYHWLRANGHFPRTPLHSRASNKAQSKSDAARNMFCAFCGQQLAVHRKSKGVRLKEIDDSGPMRVCVLPEWASRMPIMDVQELRAHQGQDISRPTLEAGYLRWSSAYAQSQLVRMVDPALTLAVQQVVSSLQLNCLTSSSRPVLAEKEEREHELAPFALLAVTVHVLIQRLVSGSLQAMADAAPKGSALSSCGPHGSRKRLLVPTHVIRGLMDGARRKGSQNVQRALSLSMTRLGVPVSEELLADSKT